MSLPELAGVPIAVAAAASFGGAAYLQHAAARQAPERGPLRPALIWDLLKIAGFRWSILLSILGFVLQVAALSVAPLALVQPLLVAQLIFYLILVTIRLHHTPDGQLMLGAGLAAAGLAVFLVVSRPAPTPPGARINGSSALIAGVVLAVVVVLALITASRLRSEWRSVPLAVACAVCYGVTAALVRTLTFVGFADLFTHWELYAIVVVAPMGFLLNQNAFQNGLLGSVAVSTITVGDPIVSIAVGAIWLGETLIVGPGWTTGQVISMLAVIGGILLLTRRAQLVADAAPEDSVAEASG